MDLAENWRCGGMSYEQAVLTFGDVVTRLCLVRLRRPADADDVFQNVFMKLYRKPPQVEDPEGLKAWLIRVTIRETVSWRRRWHRENIESLETMPEMTDTTSRDRELLILLRSLPPIYRDTLYLHYYEGYKVEEIAAMCDRAPGTVKSQLSRGREMLGQLLEAPPKPRKTPKKGESL